MISEVKSVPFKKFNLEDIEELLYSDKTDCFIKLVDDITDHGRWEVVHRIVFQEKETEKYYSVYYEEPATENQDFGQSWFETDRDNMVECNEVVPVQVTVTQYKLKE